jgi:Asp-tRNA(Asn)/Glu-tRNA(Gln) amidotransferase A subunit family amidase
MEWVEETMKRSRTMSVAALALAMGIGICVRPSVAQQAGAGSEPFNVVEATIPAIHAAMKAGELTAHQLVQHYLDRIAAYDQQGPDLNCIISLNSEALAEANRLDAAFKRTSQFVGSLHGIPVLVKDEIDTVGMPTTLGSVVFKDYRPTLDAFVIARLRTQGAIILGKTTLGEFAAGDTYGSGFARPGEAVGVSRNPYDLARTVGGSSGGSGSCLAASFSTVALGEETRASIRRPGSFNAVVSMRPTAGLVSRAGMYDGWPTEHASMGPMARTVGDLARLMDVMVRYDPEDPLTALGVGHKPASYVDLLQRDALKGAHIGVLRTDLGGNSDQDSQDYRNVMAVFNQAVGELKAAGATVVDPIVIPGLIELQGTTSRRPEEEALDIWLARNPNSPFRTLADIARSPDVDKIFPSGKAERWKSPWPPFDPAGYGRYLFARQQLLVNILKVMADHNLDAIVHRTMERSPGLITSATTSPGRGGGGGGGTPTLNTFLVYVPAITVPSAFTPDRLPTGLTFLGRPYADANVISLAYAYEQATRHRVPPRTTPPLER